MVLEVILRLDVVQESRDLSDEERDIRARLKRGVIGLAVLERSRKRQALRVTNLKEGDANTMYFHLRGWCRLVQRRGHGGVGSLGAGAEDTMTGRRTPLTGLGGEADPWASIGGCSVVGLRGSTPTLATLAIRLCLRLVVGFRLTRGRALTTAALANACGSSAAVLGNKGDGGSVCISALACCISSMRSMLRTRRNDNIESVMEMMVAAVAKRGPRPWRVLRTRARAETRDSLLTSVLVSCFWR
jgi:hypothetical protein